MAQSETVERILDAAEQLFAEKGFAETSLRLITSKAGVNLAAVNYHFGSKKALIQAVFSRFLGPFCASLERELDRREALTDKKDTLEELLEILVEQALAVKPRSGDDLSIFMRLLGLAFSQSQGHLRRRRSSSHTAHRAAAAAGDGQPGDLAPLPGHDLGEFVGHPRGPRNTRKPRKEPSFFVCLVCLVVIHPW